MIRDVVINGSVARIRIEGTRVHYERESGEILETAFSMIPAGPGQFSVLFGERSHRVVLGSGGEVLVNGRALSLEVFDPRNLRSGRRTAANPGRQEVAAFMPGKIIRVLVDAGESVEEGQGLVVVEAMKMQNEMKSPKSGRVAELRTKAEATVAAGDVLMVIE